VRQSEVSGDHGLRCAGLIGVAAVALGAVNGGEYEVG
jgi:hypothetical protein